MTNPTPLPPVPVVGTHFIAPDGVTYRVNGLIQFPAPGVGVFPAEVVPANNNPEDALPGVLTLTETDRMRTTVIHVPAC